MVERVNSLASFYKGTNPTYDGSTRIPPKAPPPNTSTVQLRFEQLNFAGIHSVHCRARVLRGPVESILPIILIKPVLHIYGQYLMGKLETLFFLTACGWSESAYYISLTFLINSEYTLQLLLESFSFSASIFNVDPLVDATKGLIWSEKHFQRNPQGQPSRISPS